MRILHVSWEFPPVIYGGLGRHVTALAAQQAALGHEVVVVTQHGDDTADDEVVRGVRVVRARETHPEPRSLDNLINWVDSMQAAMAPAGSALARDWAPDVVHAHDWVVGEAAAAIADEAGAPLVVTMHATEAGRHQGWIVGALSHDVHGREWLLAHRADALIVCSRAMREEVRAAFGAPTPVEVVPNGVDLHEWRTSEGDRRQARREAGAVGVPLVVYSGRLVWEKGVQTLIEAVPDIAARHPGLRVLIAGRGPLEAELRDLAARTAASAVEFAGFLPEQRLRPLVAAADCAVVPSRYEPFGMVAVEAAALGTPVVASDVGGLREVVDPGRTGLLVPPGDPEALAHAVAQVLSDPVRADAMAAAAHRRAAEVYDWPVIAGRTVGVYESAVRRAGGGRQAASAAGPGHGVPPPPASDGNVFTGERVVRHPGGPAT